MAVCAINIEKAASRRGALLGRVFKIRSAAVPGRSDVQIEEGFREFPETWQLNVAAPGFLGGFAPLR
jgi:hypothetical protein